MAILPIRVVGDPVLRTPAAEVSVFGAELIRLIADMEETMADVRGVGLAAPQVGVCLRIFTYDIDGHRGHVINPVLTTGDDVQPDQPEGCLSVPGLGYPVPRYNWSAVTGVDVHGSPVSVEGSGMLARCFQHESDHLDGSLYLDRLTGADRKHAFRTLRNSEFDAMVLQTRTKRAESVQSSFGRG